MIKPTLEEVTKYIKDEGFYDVNPEKFWSYYENRNWCTGKRTPKMPYGAPMINWHLAVPQFSHTTKAARLLYINKTCACGCGRKPTIIADGKCYALDKCVSKASKPLFVDSEKKIQNIQKKDLINASEPCNIQKRNWLQDLTKKVLKQDETPKRSLQEMKMKLLRGM